MGRLGVMRMESITCVCPPLVAILLRFVSWDADQFSGLNFAKGLN